MLRLRRQWALPLLTLGLLLGVSATPTQAAWVDTVPVTGTTASTAVVDLKVENSDAKSNYNALDSNKMVPTGSDSGVMTVLNNGNVPLRYYMDATSTNTDGKGLASKLVVRVTNGTKGPGETCNGSTLAGTGTSFGPSLVGSAASPRTLAAGASETLCFEVTLPSNTPTTMQGADTNITFTYNASTNPSSTWSDSVPVSTTDISVPTITAPTIKCKPGKDGGDWGPAGGATLFHLHYGPGGATTTDVTGPPNFNFPDPSSGVMWVEAVYGVAAWTSGSSNSITYSVNGATKTCS